MIFNESITLYRQNNSGFEKAFFERVYLRRSAAIERADGVIREKNEITLRIFTDKSLAISTGDKIVLGHCMQEEPPEDAYVIMSITPNLTGGGKHYKICAV